MSNIHWHDRIQFCRNSIAVVALFAAPTPTAARLAPSV